MIVFNRLNKVDAKNLEKSKKYIVNIYFLEPHIHAAISTFSIHIQWLFVELYIYYRYIPRFSLIFPSFINSELIILTVESL